jgi:CRISPR-associated endonuclease/helicase Cas3
MYSVKFKAMKIFLKPLYSKVNAGVGDCPVGCRTECQVLKKAPQFETLPNCSCPLSTHQAETCAAVIQGDADILFNTSVTGDGKSLAGSLPVLLNPSCRMVGLYPTNELVEDQVRGQQDYHQKFGLDAERRIDLLYGQELSRRVKTTGKSNRFQELRQIIQRKPVLLTNPDIFHLITHFQYVDPAYENATLPLLMAEWPDYWVFDEFHIFGSHQEAAVLNSLCFIRASQQQPRKFLFTSATPKESFMEQLRGAGFNLKLIKGEYSSCDRSGYRQILQPIQMEFVKLEKQQNTLDWLKTEIDKIRSLLQNEERGRGLVILNSIAQAGQVVKLLRQLLPEVEVVEISGRIARQERKVNQAKLRDSPKPVLVIGTSAVDVGVDFKIHLLIFESSDAATVIQRLGRLGRHAGFRHYQAFCLLPAQAPWIYAQLQAALVEAGEIDRPVLQEAIGEAFNAPQEFESYRREWGALQAQGMLWKISTQSESAKVMQPVCDRIRQDLTPVYGKELSIAKIRWNQLEKEPAGKAIRTELLRFRGGTTLQAGVWDENRFYTYDLLRLLPYTHIEVVDEATFLAAAEQQGCDAEFFNYAHVYLKVQRWLDLRLDIQLRCNRDSSELRCCELTLLKGLQIDGHPQIEILKALSQKQILAFLVPLGRQQSAWDVAKELRLSPFFGLHQLTASDGQAYGCAFNQDALLLKALSGRLNQFCKKSSNSIFL